MEYVFCIYLSILLLVVFDMIIVDLTCQFSPKNGNFVVCK